MTRVLVLREEEIEGLVDLDGLAEALRTALVAIATTRVSVPDRTVALAPDGLLGAMPGYGAELGFGAKLVSVFPGNHANGRPSHQAVIVMFAAGDGTPVAILDGTYVTAVRTAMTAAVTAQALVAPGSRTIGVLGGGVQARRHVEAFQRLFPGCELRVAARSPEAARTIAKDHPGVEYVETFEDAALGADVVCCCTDAKEPILDDAWLSDGVHVSSVGSGREVPRATVARAELFVESLAAVRPPPVGAPELEGSDPGTVTQVGHVLEGTRPGRSGPAALTLYKSVGHAAEDLATAALVLSRAQREQVGATFEL